ncbi:Sensory box/GGDEF family protein [hydrothermal vent metagenome]|uniref:Sensory box/GGDEF family protein n=1 Tax=hydrothermal vent metagenome TaxID=652676 RepID=A0A1W1CAE7_9ZZZZ
MVDIDDLCELLTIKYKIDFLITDNRYEIVALSKGVNRLFDDISIGDNLYDRIYELVGYESDFEDIKSGIRSDFDIKSIYKNGYYIDINIREFKKKENFVIFIDDVTQSIEKNQTILQDRNSNELLLRELSYKNKLLDRYKEASKRSIPSMHLDKHFTIQDINTNFLNLLDCTLDDLIGVGFDTIVYHDSTLDRDHVLSYMYDKSIYNTTIQLEKVCGNTIFVNGTFVPICDDRHNLSEIVLFAHDITTQKQCSLYFEDKAVTDALTNLLNRFGFEQKIDRLLEGSDKFALLFMDLNLFKSVNDTYGHYFGDCLLSEVGSRLESIFDDDTVVARYGGDEFVILTKRCSKEEVEDISKAITESINREYVIDGKILQIGVSIGISHYPEDATTRDLLLQKADEAMYRAKRVKRGKANV